MKKKYVYCTINCAGNYAVNCQVNSVITVDKADNCAVRCVVTGYKITAVHQLYSQLYSKQSPSEILDLVLDSQFPQGFGTGMT